MLSNICFIAASAQSVSAFMTDYIKKFSEKNIKVYVITNFSKNQRNYVPVDFLFKNPNIKAIHVPFTRKPNIFLDIFCLIKLIYIFNKNSINLFCSITPKAGFLSSIAGYFSKIKFKIHIFTGQVWYNKKGFQRYYLKIIDIIISKLNTSCLVDSKTQKNFLFKEKIFDELSNNLKLINNGSICGVDTELFKKIDIIKKKNIKKKFNIDNESKLIIFLGRLNQDKGVFDLAKAFDLVKKNYKNKLKLIYVGFDEEKCQTRIKKISKYYDDILFFNYSQTSYEFLQIADIFCLPSYREGFGLSALEAGSCEVPAVTSNTIGLSDVVSHELTGLTHDPGDINKIYQNILRLLSDDIFCIKLGKNARTRIVKLFKKNDVVNNYFKYINFLYSSKKIAIIGTSVNSIYNFRGSLIQFLKDKNFHIFGYAGQPKLYDKKPLKSIDIQFNNYFVSNAKFNFLKELAVTMVLFFKLRKKNIDIVFSYTLKAVIFYGILKFFKIFKNQKSIAFITGVGNAFIDYDKSIIRKFYFFICKFLYYLSLKYYDKILFQNKDDEKLFLTLKIINSNKSRSIIPSSGIEIKKFQILNNHFPKKLTFGLASRMIINKGILEFCEAAKNINAKYNNVEFRIAGEFEDSIFSLDRKVMKKKFVESNIQYLGWTNNIFDFLSDLSVFILPSYREGTPRSVLEAMAAGRPIITTNVPGCKETVIDNYNGFLVENKDHRQIENAILKFIKNDSLIYKMGNNSLKMVKEKFDIDIVNNKIYKEFKNVMSV